MADKSGRKPPRPAQASRHNVHHQGMGYAQPAGGSALRVVLQPWSDLQRPVARPDFHAQSVVPDFIGPHNDALVDGLSARALSLGVNESSLLRTLLIARRLLRGGWAQNVAWCDPAGRSTPADMGPSSHFSLVGAIRTASGGDLVGEYAIRHVRRVLGEFDLRAWNDNPVRTRAQVLDLLDVCIENAGGRRTRRGGWAVSGIRVQ
jgi:hypothetical protein